MSRRRTTPRSKHKTSQEIAPVFYQLIIQVVIKQTKKLLVRRKKFVSRRAHKSFRLTRRRDYKRSLSMPGYWSFTNYVRSVLWKNKWLLTKFIAFYALFSGIILGIMSQQNYKLLSSTIQSVGGDALHGQLGNLGQGFVISAGILTSSFTGQLSQAQQVYGGLVFLLGWLSIIWLLRQVLAGHKKTRLRDGLYSSGAPLLSTFLIFLLLLLQTIPFAVAVLGYVAASTINVLGNPLFSVLFWSGELLLVLLSLYWLSNSLIAFVVVTLPGMYPIKALKAASDLVVGRRLRLLYRLSWLLLSIVVIWLLTLIISVLIANIAFFKSLPIVPLVVLLLTSFTLVWSATYIYLLYRKLVDDNAPTS